MSQIPEPVRQAAASCIARHAGTQAAFDRVTAVGGGCINRAFCVEVSGKKYFLKWNDAAKFPGMFESEARGLRLLRQAGELYVPEVMESAVAGPYTYILMEWIGPGRSQQDFWNEFGRGLARLHRHSQDSFGLDHDNYIGLLEQSNTPNPIWTDFFAGERLVPQFQLAQDAGALGSNSVRSFENLLSKLPGLVPGEKPALLHGDLWNGNFLISAGGEACLVDPAVYYGHREMDLAMTRLFGGFDEEFYKAYEEEFPLEKGHEERTDIHNLYPLLVHVNLFGGSYVAQVQRILSRF